MLVQMALFHSFLWLSNIPLYISTTSSLGKVIFLRSQMSNRRNLSSKELFQSNWNLSNIQRSLEEVGGGQIVESQACIFYLWRMRKHWRFLRKGMVWSDSLRLSHPSPLLGVGSRTHQAGFALIHESLLRRVIHLGKERTCWPISRISELGLGAGGLSWHSLEDGG